MPSLRELDEQRGEFWVSNPFIFADTGENLSAYERNRLFLNTGERSFLDLSYLSGADNDGDGRTAVAWDITGDGMPELFVRQVSGGPLLIYRNRFPQTRWLNVSLRGTRSNSLGVGAKLICEAGGRRICRELYPIVNFLSQAPAAVHFGLAHAKEIDSLTIRWPSGEVQKVTEVPIDQHVLITEGRSPDPLEVLSGGETE